MAHLIIHLRDTGKEEVTALLESDDPINEAELTAAQEVALSIYEWLMDESEEAEKEEASVVNTMVFN